MVIDHRPFDNLYTVTETEQPYDGSSSSSQQQLSLYNYSLSDPQLFSPPTTGSRTYLSGAVTTPGMHNDKSNLGQTQFQIGAGATLEYQRIRSNDALYHISQMLMEDVDERVDLHQGEAALQAAEKPFYDILAQVYPQSLNQLPLHRVNELDIPDENTSSNNYHYRLHNSHPSYTMLQPLPTPLSPYSYGRSLFLPNQHLVSAARTSTFGIPGLQTRRGVEGAKRFIPSIDKLVINLDSDRLSISKMTTKAKVGDKSKYAIFEVTDQRNNPYIMDLDILEGRNSKRYAITYCEINRNETFDRVLLCYGVKNFTEASNLRETMAKEASKNSLNGKTRGSVQRKLRGKKQIKKDVVDLRSLLIHCAQAVAADDRLLASELVKKIRQHSSADGDSSQRLAFYLVDGLEARLAGIGSQVYRKLIARRTSTENMLKAYSLYLSACPFERASFTFANQTILDASKGQQPRKVHIVDFGICTGFQWPSLIQRFANEEGGPPKLRITGIDMPQPGFHPCEIIEETGKRLADYANLFEVPFQYQGIASRWETIQIEDLNIDMDEVLIINCMFRMKNLGDETVAMNSARDRVLKTMRMMNPRVFILGIVNGSYSSPFFITRFKEVLFHYSSLFDMIDANVPRDNEARRMIERGLFGKDALNIIACEGAERTERPESYKQWQARCLKAGFRQLPVDPATLKEIINMKKGIYHEDFVADEDGGWLLQGWKGRVNYAISTWA